MKFYFSVSVFKFGNGSMFVHRGTASDTTDERYLMELIPVDPGWGQRPPYPWKFDRSESIFEEDEPGPEEV